ncbi:MAG: aminotransferase class V-fold PLP-dependent enzyme [Clostridiales bacterium]|nr:aminotransferase class V-fold PLP-dependent enzyme [Clostridiales bacterium]
MDKYLLDQLTEYTSSDAYPLHMPGHKRQMCLFEHPYSIDITEIDGFDNLHHAEPAETPPCICSTANGGSDAKTASRCGTADPGILHTAQERAARLYGAEETYYLINGSTCGILASVSAALRRGGRILMARNSHKASYHAALLNGLHVTWLYPKMDERRGIYGSISAEQVREALDGQVPDRIRAVLITSPTYDGVVSDIRAIAEEVHRAGALLIVDEAHGAHFAMHPYFPDSALVCGADIVINSLHKTMPSLTQTALLHVQGPRVDRNRLRKYLAIYQSSSPSYVLMAGMDECVRLMETRGPELFDRFVRRLTALRERLEKMKVLHLVTGDEPEIAAFAFDRAKILISTERIRTAALPADNAVNGPALAEILRKRYHLEVEMAAENYVTAIMTVADTQEGFDRLEEALLETDGQLWEAGRCGAHSENAGIEHCGEHSDSACSEYRGEHSKNAGSVRPRRPIEVMTMAEADNAPQEAVPIGQSPGRTAAEFVYLYPPGIPLLVPGERVPDELPELLAGYQAEGLSVQGMADYSAKTICCVVERAYVDS